MKTPRTTRLRWALADWLCRLANRLRGHKSYDLGYDLRGNRAATIRDHLCIFVAMEPNGSDLVDELDELAELARATWWHDPVKERERMTP